MRKISNILLAIDEDHDDQALLTDVLSLTGNNPANVTILNVTNAASGYAIEHAELTGLQQAEVEQRTAQLGRLAAILEANNIVVTLDQAVGKSHLEIIQKTLNNEFDLVMKPARKEAGLKQFLLGSEDVQLTSLCADPVWIFPPTGNRTLKKIGVAVDLLPSDPERSALAADILRWGKSIATLVGAELHVLHAWGLYRETSMRSSSVTPQVIDKLALETQARHHLWLNDAVKQIEPSEIAIHKHLRKGDAELLITQMTDALDIDLLIMGTVGRTGIPGFFIGNTADSILRNVNCSVLTIKPEKFQSPVKPSK